MRIHSNVQIQVDPTKVPSEITVTNSDQILLRKFKGGSEDAATEIFLRYARRIHGLADAQIGTDLKSRFDGDSIVQTVFRTFFRRAKDGQYDVASGDDLWKLFLVISLNKIRRNAGFHRADKRDPKRTVSIHDAEKDEACFDQSSLSVLTLTIEEIVEKLPENHQQIVQFRIDGMTVEEIAEKTKTARRTVERVLQSFRENLLEEIAPDE